jgi:hypothetical protein
LTASIWKSLGSVILNISRDARRMISLCRMGIWANGTSVGGLRIGGSLCVVIIVDARVDEYCAGDVFNPDATVDEYCAGDVINPDATVDEYSTGDVFNPAEDVSATGDEYPAGDEDVSVTDDEYSAGDVFSSSLLLAFERRGV